MVTLLTRRLTFTLLLIFAIALVTMSKSLLLVATGKRTYAYIDHIVPEATRSRFGRDKNKCRVFFKYSVDENVYRNSKLFSIDDVQKVFPPANSCLDIESGDSIQVCYSSLMPRIILLKISR